MLHVSDFQSLQIPLQFVGLKSTVQNVLEIFKSLARFFIRKIDSFALGELVLMAALILFSSISRVSQLRVVSSFELFSFVVDFMS